MKLGENILKLRKENKFSQEELAKQLNVTRQTISNWELGETQPTPEQLKILSKIFNVSIDELLDNNIDDILLEKVNNTERLAGIIIKILKGIGIAFLILLVIDIISLIVFNFVNNGMPKSDDSKVTLNCSLNENDYLITVRSDEYFNCSNCSIKIQNDLDDIINYSDIQESKNKIINYFSNNNGNCE